MKKIKTNIVYQILLFALLNSVAYGQMESIFISKMTAINPTSYTDVIFTGIKDTVLVSTYSGRISEYVRQTKKEKIISQINDEIYVLAYNPLQKHIAASTLESGILIINKENGKIINKLDLIETWSLRVDYSTDFKYLFANDQRGNRFVWNVGSNYKPVQLPNAMPKGSIIAITDDIFTIITSNNLIRWNLKHEKIIEQKPIQIAKLGDIDREDNILSINFNICELYSTRNNKSIFTLQHPSWLRKVESIGGEDAARTAGLKVSNGYFEDPNYQMAITYARFSKNKIFTSSIDRSIRIWDKSTGQLVNSLTGHQATINKMKVSKFGTQLVSVDLKGGIRFWDID